MRFSPASASSRARTEASRPTMNGTICCGNMTISRTGIMGTRLSSIFSRLNMVTLKILQVPGPDLLENLDVAAVRRGRLDVSVEAERPLAGTALDNFFQPHKGASTDEQDVGRVHRSEFLMGMLATALRRNIGDCAFQNLQQSLLDAFPGDIARNRRVFVLLRDLVDLIYIDDALLGFGYISVGRLEQLEDDIFDVLSDVACLGQRGGVHNGERYIEHSREGLRQ